MKKRLLVLLMTVVSTAFIFGSCSVPEGISQTDAISQIDESAVVPEKIPNITITLEDGMSIPYVSAENQWNGIAVKREPLLKGGMTLSIAPIAVAGGQSFSIDFGEIVPQNISIYSTEFQYGMSSARYLEGEVKEEIPQQENGHFLVRLPSSQIQESGIAIASEKSQIIRGYSITAQWGENICEYAFIVSIPPFVEAPAPAESSASAEIPETASAPPAQSSAPAQQPGTTTAPSSKPPATPATATGGVFSGYSVTVLDKTTPATTIGSPDWPIKTMYFYDGSGNTLGSISGTAYEKIMSVNKDSAGNPPVGVDWNTWFANQFNLYRGIGSAQENAKPSASPSNAAPPSSANAPSETSMPSPPTPSPASSTSPTGQNNSSGASSLASLIADQRSAEGCSAQTYDSSLQDLADTRAMELSQLWGHKRPDGTSVTDTHTLAEIITRSNTADSAFQNFYNSSGHKAIMLSEKYSRYVVGSYTDGNGYTYWVVLFGF